MRIREMTWAEYGAWLAVTDRAARYQRADATLDAYHAHVGGDALTAHLEKLRGE